MQSATLDAYHYEDSATALPGIDDALGGYPLIGFQTLGSILFAEDLGVPSQYHTAPSFLLGPRGRNPSIVNDEPFLKECVLPERLDQSLTMTLKRPIQLPRPSSPLEPREGDNPNRDILAIRQPSPASFYRQPSPALQQTVTGPVSRNWKDEPSSPHLPDHLPQRQSYKNERQITSAVIKRANWSSISCSS